MPASVLLALLAATCLLALTPALVRRYDPDERMIADRKNSDARVLTREAHRPDRPIPHQAPGEGAPEAGIDDLLHPDTTEPQGSPGPRGPRAWERRGGRRGGSVRLETDESVTGEDPEMHETDRLRQMRAQWWRRRHRRILYVLIALTLVELIGVIIAGPGFWIGAGASVAVLGAYVYFLRERAKRLAREQRRPKAMITAEPEHEEVGPPTYVPEQPGSEGEPEPDSTRESYLFGGQTSGDEDEPPPPPPRPDARRSEGSGSGGVRGRSYESPAKLER
ncbi:hypothetical protein [Glycomyces buryatensis]|uniref:Uncharacterized protein n=1 Tax=Glycomyces buryatensis TaxID=2570927 RepID=A0A4S8QFE1_9ACTN|nr:hypothetical protein [Glycomyces buryatensis]THV43138.1 hypothetical protein FAB82_02595 [Glycomyces buryatensis]